MMFHKCWYWYYTRNSRKPYYNGGSTCRVRIVGISAKWHKYDLMFEKKLVFIPVLLIIIKCMNANPGQRKRNKTFLLKLARVMCRADRVSTSLWILQNVISPRYRWWICKMIQNLRIVTVIRWYLREVESSWHCGPDIPMLRSGFATPNVLNNRCPGKSGERNTPPHTPSFIHGLRMVAVWTQWCNVREISDL